jgi:cysteinyl-tRNA synthetase
VFTYQALQIAAIKRTIKLWLFQFYRGIFTMVTPRAKKTKEELLKEAEAKVKSIRQQIKIEKDKQKAALTKESEGMAAAIAAIENVAKANKVKVADVIRAIAKIKRAGLKIESTREQGHYFYD